MNEFPFQIKVGSAIETAQLRFADHNQLLRYHRSLGPFASQPLTAVREAVEFTRLAAKRWRYYARSDEAVESLAALRREIRHNPQAEVAFIMVAVMSGKRGLPAGLAYCRRTWCHHLALDFLALHPRVLDQTGQVSGVGSGIVFGLVQLATALHIPTIWGEATANSAAFYEKLLEQAPVRDLFLIESREMATIQRRQARLRGAALVTRRSNKLQ